VWKNFNACDAYHDVLGTLFGSYQAGLEALGFSDAEDQYAEAEKLGFDISDEFRNSYFDGSDAWIDLACLWHEVIVDRQENGVPQ
jgi:hypothetical protein